MTARAPARTSGPQDGPHRKVGPRHRLFRASVVVGLIALSLTGVTAAQEPPPVAKTIVIDGKPMGTDGKIVTIDGNRILFDGRPVVVDGKPLTTDGRTVLLDGKTVVQKGKFLSRPAMLVFTVDTRVQATSAYRIERDVTVPIERALRTVPGILDIHSTVVGARTQTRLVFAPSTDPASTESTIRLRIDQIKLRLPIGAGRPAIAWRREIAEPVAASSTAP